ncbi:phospholipase A [Desulfosediminicola flagellatus]|uniref:phospholipase A n=1 Tax=Desulfosediminicola flagellatus TaxID=2569541 RepID=UPI0010AB9869|nr:phospholipase A [Desulfosediminicola flagellatus]
MKQIHSIRPLTAFRQISTTLLISCFLIPAVQPALAAPNSIQSCIEEKFQSAPDSMTMGEIRSACQSQATAEQQPIAEDSTQPGAIETRIQMDRENVLKPFTIMSHKQNYILLGAYNFKGYNSEEFETAFDKDSIDLDDIEAQFQLSIKTPLAVDIFKDGISLWSAYTVRSFWQVYNNDISSPFRETNHEPEAWVQFIPDFDILGFSTTAGAVGIVHQSNGQAGNLSRSWNRVYASLVLEKGNFVIAFKPWFRIEEDFEDDDNPDITDFLGHGEIRMAYKYNDHVFTLMSRNNLESGFSQGAVELGWSFPIYNFPYLKGYVQYFSGYGESLIDYDEYVNRLGVGLLLTDLL